MGHNSAIYDKCQTQPAEVLALPSARTYWLRRFVDTVQPLCEFQISFLFILWNVDGLGAQREAHLKFLFMLQGNLLLESSWCANSTCGNVKTFADLVCHA